MIYKVYKSSDTPVVEYVVNEPGFQESVTYMWVSSRAELNLESLWKMGLDPQRSKVLIESLLEKGLIKKICPSIAK